MRITKWGEFGILCALFLGSKTDNDGEPISVGAAEIAESQSIPLQYTQQILQRLRKGEIIESIRGPKGGYKLSRNPEKISLLDVLLAAEGDTFEVICDTNPVHGESCAQQSHTCGLKPIWGELKETIDTFLSQYSLAQVIKNHSFEPGKLGCQNSAESKNQTCCMVTELTSS